MSEFEVFFSLFGLLIGFTLVELLRGFVHAFKASFPVPGGREQAVRLGWFTPLLGLYVLLDLTSSWVNVWAIRSSIGFGYDTAFALVVISGAYFFAASMIFPDRAEDCPDLDEWFWNHRRQVLGALAAVMLIGAPFYASLNPSLAKQIAGTNAFVLILIASAAVSRNKWVVKGSLGILVSIYLMIILGNAATRFGH